MKLKYGSNNPAWKGGKINSRGYIMLRIPEHHRARKNGYVLEHIVVMENILDRQLKDNECIHHINGIRSDNRPENLRLFSSNSEHHKPGNHPSRKHYCKCGQPSKGYGLCARHLAQFKRTGRTWDFENKLIRKNRPKFCHCGQPVKCRDLCSRHYQQWRKDKIGTNIKAGYMLEIVDSS